MGIRIDPYELPLFDYSIPSTDATIGLHQKQSYSQLGYSLQLPIGSQFLQNIPVSLNTTLPSLSNAALPYGSTQKKQR